jgi:protein O-mannosyl-transferase
MPFYNKMISTGEDVAPPQSRFKVPLFLLMLTGIIFLIYANGLNTPFQSDDERHVILNPNIDNPSFYFNPKYITYRHINNFTFALNYHWGQQNTFGYHLFNLLLHICTVILVFLIVNLTIKNATEWGKEAALKIAAITALLFGLHPIQTETITYISGRPGGLAGVFYFFSVLMYLLGGLKRSKIPNFIYYSLSLLTFFMAVLSKEIAVTLPIILILYDICFMRGENWKSFRSRLWFYILFPVMVILAYFQSHYAFTAIGDLLKKTNLSLILVQLDILKHPLKLFLFPINLTFEYDFKTQVMWGSLLVSLFLLATVLFLVIKNFYLKSSILSFSYLWFLITLTPTNSVMPRTQLLSERNLYIPYFGLSLFVAVILYLTFLNKNRNKVAIALLLLVGFSFSSLVVKRNQDYSSQSSLWADTFKKSPNKLSVGKTSSIHFLMEENYPEALKTLNTLLKINPGLYDVHQNMGLAYKNMGDISKAEKKFKDAIGINFNAPEAHFNLASLYGNLGKAIEASKEFDISAKLFRGHINQPPKNFYTDKARSHNQAGIAFSNAKKYDSALEQFKKSVQQNPLSLEAQFNLAKLLLEFKNDKAKASIHIREALKLSPNAPQAQALQNLLLQTQD